MARPSSIQRLPAAIRELIGSLRSRGHTIDEILEHLRELDVDVSRSALGRHTQQLDTIGEQIRRSRWVGEALIERLGEAPESRQARINIELMHSLIMDLLAGEGGETVKLTPESAMLLATSLSRLAAAHKSDVDRELKLRERVATAAADKVEEVARGAGLSGDTVEQFRRAILGVTA